MADPAREQAIHAGRNVRLETLVRLRWLAVIGQTTAVLVVYVGLDFELPIWACLAHAQRHVEPDGAARLRSAVTERLALLLAARGGPPHRGCRPLLAPLPLAPAPPRRTRPPL